MSDDVIELQRQVTILKQAVDQSQRIHKSYDNALLLIKQKDKELKESYAKLQEMQEEIIQREKMASLGSLVAGVAHEVNTPLGVSITSASMIQESCNKIRRSFESEELTEEDLKEFLDGSIDACSLLLQNLENAARLIRGFKQISVDETSDQKREFDVKQYLEEIIRTLKPQLKKSVATVELECPENIIVNSYAGSFAQIFSNLIQNSLLHAFEGKDSGKIVIKVIDKGDRLDIEYIDDGIGIDESVKDKVFEPFVTTKRARGGSGLGLSIVYNLISSSFGGSVKVESEKGCGVHFYITLLKS
ncbi:MAG: HAMP domain-containing sensor histidine kinase [Sulfuricurvum sp.]|uniref:sensor histidine kinase n=1 Tax=Sulfuricurvum sp. TaxID=2025608 RepID=UPI0026205EF5|nr:HAMP domain-containing sensor histidine kinase [Sulfuricurvum sp.]MDD2829251.1 HAMP domain-containing sensor histidine kinase [Sulfuricurvum sp.]MDD4949985.1 HAMP domain-containing sensor histidine kinase [Sulfuricurvum sp.]